MRFMLAVSCLSALMMLWAPVGNADARFPQMPHGGWKSSSIEGNRYDREAVILFSFTVKADGTLADITPTDGFYNEDYTRLLLSDLKGKKMIPALLDEVPVDFRGMKMLWRLDRRNGQLMTPGFRQRYQKVADLVKAGQSALAVEAITDLIEHQISSNYEYAFLNAALVPILSQLGRTQEAFRASRFATLREGLQEAFVPTGSRIRVSGDKNWPYLLPRENILLALRQQFVIAVELQNYQAALSAYQQLAALSPFTDDDPMLVTARRIEQKLQTGEPIASLGQIFKGRWTYQPMRPAFSLPSVQNGALQFVDVSCAFHQQTYPWSAGVQWVLQQSWGPCSVTIRGDEGATFTLVEYARPAN